MRNETQPSSKQRLLNILHPPLHNLRQPPPRRRQLLPNLQTRLQVHPLRRRKLVLNRRLLTTSNTRTKLQLQDLPRLVASREQTVQIVFGVRGGDAEPHAGGNERRGGVPDDDDGDFALEHFAREGGDFCGVVEKQGDDGRVVVAVDDEAEAFQSEAQVAGVEGEALQALFALAGGDVAGDDFEGGGDLGEHGWRGGFAEDGAGVCHADFVDDGFRGADVAAVSRRRTS